MSTYSVVEILGKKKAGEALSDDEIKWFVKGFAIGDIPDYQCAAFLMAVCCKGMTSTETAVLTRAMKESGVTADLSDIVGPKVDKHSTGGVGDKTSLILAPIVASLGAVVPMMSGRGLGHTGGTLDKLEAIPGFRVAMSSEEFKEALRSVGVAIIGTTADMAPADKKMYALRDVTCTVASLPLITGSIMCKKLAENPDRQEQHRSSAHQRDVLLLPHTRMPELREVARCTFGHAACAESFRFSRARLQPGPRRQDGRGCIHGARGGRN